MNKQEAIEKIESSLMYENTRHIGKAVNIYDVIDIINQIDELEKPVVPQFIAEWYEENKDKFERQLLDCTDVYCLIDTDFGEWFGNSHNKPFETLVNMHQFGYDIKKEKLYTAKLKSTGEYMYLDRSYKDFYHIKVSRDVAQNCKHYHFTKTELMNKQAWENDAYYVEKVEK